MKNNILLLVFLSSILMSSCIIYQPMTTDIPLIHHKKDLRIDAGVSMAPSFYTTISYGLTDKIALQGFANVGLAGDRYYFQVAPGLYKNRGNNKIFELYSGFGYGYGNAFSDANAGNLLGNYQVYFVQTNFGKIAGKSSALELGFGLKGGYLHSNLTDRNFYNFEPRNGPYKTYYDNSLLFEPTGFLRLGKGNFKLSLKLGATWIHKLSNKKKEFPYSRYNLGIGLNYRL